MKRLPQRASNEHLALERERLGRSLVRGRLIRVRGKLIRERIYQDWSHIQIYRAMVHLQQRGIALSYDSVGKYLWQKGKIGKGMITWRYLKDLESGVLARLALKPARKLDILARRKPLDEMGLKELYIRLSIGVDKSLLERKF